MNGPLQRLRFLLIPLSPLCVGGGSVQQGLSDAGGVCGSFEFCSATDKRYSVGRIFMFASVRQKLREYIDRNERDHALARLPVVEDQLSDHQFIPIVLGPKEELAGVNGPELHVLEIFNDEKTPAEYVSRIIEMYSRRSFNDAMVLTMQIHYRGSGAVLAGSARTLELVANLIRADAKFRQYPLRCEVRAA